MDKNKSPLQTVEQIIQVATKLFIEKGYDKTSIQDILNELGISKGGLYHHFKSKEEILDVVIKRRSEYASNMLNELVKNTKANSSKEKLEKILLQTLNDKKLHSLNTVLSTQVKNPQFVVGGLHACINKDAPIIAKLIEEGYKDGSLNVKEPLICAEIFLLLSNFWVNPHLFGRTIEETRERFKYLQSLMRLLGADIIRDELIDLVISMYMSLGVF